MQTRNLLAARRRAPIRIPSRPVIGLRSVSSAVAAGAEWLGSAGEAVAVDLEVQNVSDRRIEGRFGLATSRPFAAGPAFGVEPGEAVELADVAPSVASAPAFDAAVFEGDGAAEAVFTARTYAPDLPAAAGATSLGSRRVVAGLAESDDAWSELEIFNPSAAATRFVVRVRGFDGAALAETSELVLGPREARTWSLRDLAPRVAGETLSAELLGLGGPAPEARGVVHAAGVEGRVLLRAQEPASLLYLPATGGRAGAGGSRLETDVVITNAADRGAAVRVRFLEAERDGSAAPAAVVLLGAGETRRLRDAVGALFGASEVDGVLEISSGGPLAAAGVLVARSGDEMSSAARGIPAIAPERFARRTLVADSVSGAPRRVRLINPGGVPVAVVFRALAVDGTVVWETATMVPASAIFAIAVAPPDGAAEAVALRIEADRSVFAAAATTDRIRSESGGVREPVRVAR